MSIGIEHAPPGGGWTLNYWMFPEIIHQKNLNKDNMKTEIELTIETNELNQPCFLTSELKELLHPSYWAQGNISEENEYVPYDDLLALMCRDKFFDNNGSADKAILNALEEHSPGLSGLTRAVWLYIADGRQ